MVNFDCDEEDMKTIQKISKRAVKMLKDFGSKRNQLDIDMDITAAHCNGNPLRLKEFLEADDFNFIHDISGIGRHLNRDTGKLENCFLPRFSA